MASEYRVKGVKEPYERVVHESEMTDVPGPKRCAGRSTSRRQVTAEVAEALASSCYRLITYLITL
jgi:hypothetical protein